MPIYEYQCQSCEDIIEKWQSLTDAPLTTCPSCSGNLKKLISMSSFQLKGGGWYADGYAANGSSCKKSSPADSPASTTDSKPTCASDNSCCGCS